MPRSKVKTISTCQPPEMVQGTHVFDILGFSKHRGLGFHSAVQSGAFTVGGHQWAVIVYPDGYRGAGGEDEPPEVTANFVAVCLNLLSASAKVNVSCDIRFVDHATGVATSMVGPAIATLVRLFDPEERRDMPCMFKHLDEIEKKYLRDDRLTIECAVTVRKEPRVSKTKAFPRIKVPHTNIKRQLANLLEQEEGADVVFSVAGEIFAAHKLVLAMRSPVFKAELCGPLSDATGKKQHIVIEDMQPDVFRTFLYFIYTDSIRGVDDDVDEDYSTQNCEMVRHLLVAADRYDVDRLKLICQHILCKNLHVRTVATTLALAHQHHCDRLKDACIEFMSCLSTMDDLVATEGYQDLQRTDPSILADAMAKMSQLNKKQMQSSE